MNSFFHSALLASTGAQNATQLGVIQQLWSGYGSIIRYSMEGGSHPTVIVKHIRLPQPEHHPRGWNTDLSHQRKLKSYQVETEWYKTYSKQCDDACRVPHCLAIETFEDEVMIVLEDLDAAGFDVRKTSVRLKDMYACLDWLANFHATFLHSEPEGLWPTGTYWHLETRPDELKELKDRSLKEAASEIDDTLKNAQFQTFVHGDAKLANFCFPSHGNKVAAVDFQYVGKGCGMKDVAYFIGSCLYEEDCEKYEGELLNAYFKSLETACAIHHPTLSFPELKSEWEALYPFAWTDFHRFIKGWSPGHWKIHSYSERISREVIEKLKHA